MLRGGWRRSAAALVPAAMLAGCGGGVLDPQGPVAEGNRTILLNSLAVMLAIVVPTLVAALAFAWWFRASNPKAGYKPGFVYSGRIELIVWSIPTLTILFIGGLIYYGSYAQDPRRPLDSKAAPIEVQVVALDWKWLFIYPEAGVASVNELVLPAGVPVRFRLTSASVMNTFFVPQLGSMVYAMNGMENVVHLQADRTGTFFGESAHFSGDGFADMNFVVRAVAPEDFGRWTAGLKDGPARVLDGNAYRELSKQSEKVAPFGYSAVEGGLFDAVVRRTLPPGPGPEAAEGGDADIRPAPAPEAAGHAAHEGG